MKNKWFCARAMARPSNNSPGKACAALLLIFTAAASLAAQQKNPWPVIPQDELALKEAPGIPGAHAILLYRESQTDDAAGYELIHYRIKVLTEQGRKYGDIEIPFSSDYFRIEDLEARAVRPDGTPVPFAGQVYERTVVKARGFKYLAKVFAMPEVQVGSILEYRYRLRWNSSYLFPTRWLLQYPLFTVRERFSLKPATFTSVRWQSTGLPKGSEVRKDKDGYVRLEMENVPAIIEEEFMPPEGEVQMRVDLFYLRDSADSAEAFWSRVGQLGRVFDEQFMDRRSAMSRAVKEITSPNDSPEIKLRKIYARVQSIRNLSYEPSRIQKEEKREELKVNQNVEDVWSRGYGQGWQINLLFAALARAAGFEASVARLSARSQYFFQLSLPDSRQLNSHAVLIRMDGKDVFFEPGTAFCPFGLLPWQDTGVKGVLAAERGGRIVKSPEPASSEALTERTATLRLAEDGTLEGTVRVSFAGHEALRRRLAANDDDEGGRRKDFESECKTWLPESAVVKLENVTGWQGTDTTLKLEFHIELPGYATSTGSRMMFPAAVFQSGWTHPFRPSKREHPVYFSHPWKETDELTIEIPSAYRIEELPETRQAEVTFGEYEINRQSERNIVRVKRRMVMERYYLETVFYDVLRLFYNQVRTGDEEQVVLRANAAPASN